MSAELVVATPLLLLLLLLIVQFALWQHAAHVAATAAQEALASAEVQTGTPADGTRTATDLLGQLGSGLLDDPQVTVSRTGQTAQVRVTATTEAVLPFLHLPVHATATGPLERFRPPGDLP